MSKIFIRVAFIFIVISSYAQESNEIRSYFGVLDAQFIGKKGFSGGGSYEIENAKEFGIRYLRKLNSKLYFETGINYMSSKVTIKSAPTGLVTTYRYEEIRLVTFPLFANYTIGDYLFINGGALLDIQAKNTSIDSQSGIGCSIGFGGKYSINKFNIYLNPNFKSHALIPFNRENYHQNLYELGVQFGIGYKF